MIVEDFRGFRRLDLQGLKGLNLVVGRNNCGKTSLLEGLALVSDPRRAPELPGLLRATSGQSSPRFFRWLIRDGAGGRTRLRAGLPAGWASVFLDWTIPQTEPLEHALGVPPLYVVCGSDGLRLRYQVTSGQTRDLASLVLGFGRAVRRRDGEDLIHRILKTVDPRIARVRVDLDKDGQDIMVDIGLTESVPLAQVGQGVYRLVAILSDIVGSGAAVCLIDEIENGLHHTALIDVFTGLAEAAAIADVQLFVTTHSHECLVAAHEAMKARSEYDLAVIRLFRVEEGVQGRVLERERIEAAIAGGVDVRS
ncbi:MAG: ATP-binding protein [Planctomycetes bacterium]|nr:ATP-binding protein [Planctomycetota bacterium]